MSHIIDDPHHAHRVDVIARHGVPFMVLYDPALGLVEFWDLRHPMKHWFYQDLDMPGQFIGRYTVETLTKIARQSNRWEGLILHSDEPDWCIDDRTMSVIRHWLVLMEDRAT